MNAQFISDINGPGRSGFPEGEETTETVYIVPVWTTAEAAWWNPLHATKYSCF